MTAGEPTQHEPGAEVLIEVKHLKMHFPVTSGVLVRRRAGYIKAVDDVSFVVRRGETLGLVGDGGFGEDSMRRCRVELYGASSGQVLVEGEYLGSVGEREQRLRRGH